MRLRNLRCPLRRHHHGHSREVLIGCFPLLEPSIRSKTVVMTVKTARSCPRRQALHLDTHHNAIKRLGIGEPCLEAV